MKRARQITFVDGYGYSGFAYGAFNRAVQISMQSPHFKTFDIISRYGEIVFSHNGNIAPDESKGDKIAFHGVVRDDDFTGEPLKSTLDSINSGSKPVIELHRKSGNVRVYYPITYQTFEPYEGRIYKLFKSDCWSLCADFLFDNFDIETPEASLERALEMSDKLGQDYFFESMKQLGNLSEVAVPQRGDIMVSSLGGPHCSIWLGDGKILHIMPSMLSAIEPVPEYWRDNLITYLRHNSFM